MRVTPRGTRSTTEMSARGRPALQKNIEVEEKAEAMADSMAIPQQEPGNHKTKLVFMTVKLADGWIASDQTGAFPRVSTRGN